MWSPATDTLTALVPSTPDWRIFHGRGPFQTPNQTVPQMATTLRAVRHTQSPWGEQVGIVLFYPLAAIPLCNLYSDDTRSAVPGVFKIHTLCTRYLNIIRFPSRLRDCVAHRIILGARGPQRLTHRAVAQRLPTTPATPEQQQSPFGPPLPRVPGVPPSPQLWIPLSSMQTTRQRRKAGENNREVDFKMLSLPSPTLSPPVCTCVNCSHWPGNAYRWIVAANRATSPCN